MQIVQANPDQTVDIVDGEHRYHFALADCAHGTAPDGSPDPLTLSTPAITPVGGGDAVRVVVPLLGDADAQLFHVYAAVGMGASPSLPVAASATVAAIEHAGGRVAFNPARFAQG